MTPPGLIITAAEWEIVQAVLMRHVPEREVWAFGSRVGSGVGGRIKKFSDLDLAILGDHPLPPGALAGLSDDFTECDLPYKVDLVDWATTSERFRKIIEAAHVVLTTGGTSLRREKLGALGYGV